MEGKRSLEERGRKKRGDKGMGGQKEDRGRKGEGVQ